MHIFTQVRLLSKIDSKSKATTKFKPRGYGEAKKPKCGKKRITQYFTKHVGVKI